MPSIIATLVVEHDDFRAVFKKIQQALAELSLAQIKGITQNMEKLLLSHAAAEDDLVLLAQARLHENKRRYERFRNEHLEIDGQLTQIYSLAEVEKARARLVEVFAYSERHFQHEERNIFPLLAQAIDGETLEKLGAVWVLRREGSRKPVVPKEQGEPPLSLQWLLTEATAPRQGRAAV